MQFIKSLQRRSPQQSTTKSLKSLEVPQNGIIRDFVWIYTTTAVAKAIDDDRDSTDRISEQLQAIARLHQLSATLNRLTMALRQARSAETMHQIKLQIDAISTELEMLTDGTR